MVFLPRFYFILVTAILLALASAWAPNGMAISLLLTLLLTGAVLADVVLIPREALRVRRQVQPVLRQAQPFNVKLALLNQSDRHGLFQIADSPPTDFVSTEHFFFIPLKAGKETEHVYSLRSYRRGNFAFGAVYYRITGPIGLVQHQGKIELPQTVQVLPDMSGRRLARPATRPRRCGTGRPPQVGAAWRRQRV